MPAKKQVTKEKILRAALQLLREQGYEAVNIKQLAQTLDCSTQPVYLSFSGMEELRSALTPLAAEEFERYMMAGSREGLVCLYGMRYSPSPGRSRGFSAFCLCGPGPFPSSGRPCSP